MLATRWQGTLLYGTGWKIDGGIGSNPVCDLRSGIAGSIISNTRSYERSAYLMPQYAVSSDGRFLVNTRIEDSVTPIVLILNGKFFTKK